MAYEVEYTDEFGIWLNSISDSDQDRVAENVGRLVQYGWLLDHPYSSKVFSSRHSHMRELRVQSGGNSIRVFYAFDPRRTAILLIGGNKTDDKRFYREYTPIADHLYDQHLNELRREGLIQ